MNSFSMFCPSFVPQMKGEPQSYKQTENESGDAWGLQSSLEGNQLFPLFWADSLFLIKYF